MTISSEKQSVLSDQTAPLRVKASPKILLEMLDSAVVHIKHNKNEEALKLLNEITPLSKSVPTFFYARAVAEVGLGRLDDAKSSLEELLRNDPNYNPGKDFLTQINNILLQQD